MGNKNVSFLLTICGTNSGELIFVRKIDFFPSQLNKVTGKSENLQKNTFQKNYLSAKTEQLLLQLSS